MRHATGFVLIPVFILSACAPMVLAPGAEQVRVTNLAADVAGCTAVGNIQMSKDSESIGDKGRAVARMKNLTIGYGGNTALVTESELGTPTTGVAYRCPAGQ